jgi:alkylation response protein AidB-like acyl-CoA dehydrogenase
MSIPQMPASSDDPIAEAIAHLQDEVRPIAEAIDQDAVVLGRALQGLGAKGFLGLRVPREYGGHGLAGRDFKRFQEECARASGCLAFLQTQHQSACAMIAKSDNEALKARLLPGMASGDSLCGIAFSQLRRRSDKPVLSARKTTAGYEVTGEAPWVTGLGFFKRCVTAASTDSEETMFFVHDLIDSEGLALSEPMRLASMEPAQTVSASFTQFAVGDEDVLYLKPCNWIENNDMINIALQSPFALGCSRAALDVIQMNYERKGIDAIGRLLDELSSELHRCREEAYAAMEDRDDLSRSLAARGWAIELALRCAATAVVTSSGAGNSLSHPAQRIYREALVFAVSAQTAAIMEATLSRLSRT